MAVVAETSAWLATSLANLCEDTATTNPSTRPDESFVYVDVSSVSNETFRIENPRTLLGKDAPSRARKLIETDDVIFATVRPALRRIAIVPPELDGQVCSTGFCVLRARTEQLNPNFLYVYLLSEPVRDKVEALQTGATYPAINDGDLFRLEMPLPPLPEQRAIAHALQTVQKAKETRQCELALERERKAALMEHLFTHGTRGGNTKQTDIGNIPEQWEVFALDDVARISSGGTPDRTKAEYWGGAIPWVKTGEIRYNTILATEERITQQGLDSSAAKLYPRGTLLMAMYGQGITRGKVAILGIDAAINQACAAITPSDGRLSVRFAFYYFQFTYERIRILGHGANQKNLNSHLVGSILMPVPPIEEQLEIAKLFSAMDAKLDVIKREVELLEELFGAMLQELLSGQVSVSNLVAGDK